MNRTSHWFLSRLMAPSRISYLPLLSANSASSPITHSQINAGDAAYTTASKQVSLPISLVHQPPSASLSALRPPVESAFSRLKFSTSTPPSNGGTLGEDEEPVKMTLHEAVLAIADAAVSRVELGDYDEAVAILKMGIDEFGPRFPASPEIGELHNQAGLLYLLQDKTQEAIDHAKTALDLTTKAFGEHSVLTGHRLTRLGAVMVSQGKLVEAREVLSRALTSLKADASSSEADFYLSLTDLSSATHASQVHDQTARLSNSLSGLMKGFGPDSIVLSLALKQHERVVDRALAAKDLDVVLCEALLKQHCQLVQAKEPSGESLAVSKYRYATFLYANDLLSEAANQVKEAMTILRSIYQGDDHPPLKLCMHRLGMICAASGDHRSATKLLQSSLESFKSMSKEGQQGQPSQGGSEGGGGGSSARALAVEAEFGLALSVFRAIDPTLVREKKAQAQAAALSQAKMLLDELTGLIGEGQMLSQGASRFYSQIKSLAMANQ